MRKLISTGLILGSIGVISYSSCDEKPQTLQNYNYLPIPERELPTPQIREMIDMDLNPIIKGKKRETSGIFKGSLGDFYYFCERIENEQEKKQAMKRINPKIENNYFNVTENIYCGIEKVTPPTNRKGLGINGPIPP